MVSVASALGASSLNTWLKIPSCKGLDKVARATTLPILILGDLLKRFDRFAEIQPPWSPTILDQLEDQARRSKLQRRRIFSHIGIAQQQVDAAILVRIRQRLVARIDDRPVLLYPLKEIVHDIVRTL